MRIGVIAVNSEVSKTAHGLSAAAEDVSVVPLCRVYNAGAAGELCVLSMFAERHSETAGTCGLMLGTYNASR